MSIALVLICLFVGILIGAIGIGGVLLVPALALVSGLGVHEAIPACMLSYLATGAIGVLIYARHGSIQWQMVGWLCLGAVPAAYLGSISLSSIPPNIVMSIIAIIMILAGIDALRKSNSNGVNEDRKIPLSIIQLILIGTITGFGSAITGTGGPLIIVPIALYLGLPVLTAVGLSQAIQIPIASFASIGNWVSGSLNLGLSFTIALSMIAGSLLGATLIHRLPREPIRKAVAALLVIVGSGIGLRLIYQIGGF